jgi:hypothetical protein
MTWTIFWDSYESAAHNKDELLDIDNFNYLLAADILKERFGNREHISMHCSMSKQ